MQSRQRSVPLTFDLVSHSPLVSVVTPVYNGESTLPHCINSVLAQTHQNWDLTIVNNCSTDGTLEIARAFAARDSRIRIHNVETFVRVARSYNNAVRQISPESIYCKVLAADDWLAPECIQKMVELAERHPSVAVIGAYGMNGRRIGWQGLPYPTEVVQGSEMLRTRLLDGPYVFGTPSSVLYRSDVVRNRNPFYNESNFHFDSEVCFQILENHDFGFIHQILTFQGEQEDSLTSFSKSVQTYLPWVLLELVKYGPRHLNQSELKNRIESHLAKYYAYLGEQVFNHRDAKFWTYHEGQLASLGYPLSKSRLARAAASHAFRSTSRAIAKAALRPWRRDFPPSSS